jgi:hypothetical protein
MFCSAQETMKLLPSCDKVGGICEVHVSRSYLRPTSTGATGPNAGLASTWGGKGRTASTRCRTACRVATGGGVECSPIGCCWCSTGWPRPYRRRSRSPWPERPGLQLKVANFGRCSTKKQQSGQLMGAHRGTCHGAPHRHHRAQHGPGKSWPWRHMPPCPERRPPRNQHLAQPTRSAAVSSRRQCRRFTSSISNS